MGGREYPTTNGGMQNGSSVEICTHCTHVFARSSQICMLSRCLLKKFLHRSSGGTLIRVRCLLGKKERKKIPPSSSFHLKLLRIKGFLGRREEKRKGRGLGVGKSSFFYTGKPIMESPT